MRPNPRNFDPTDDDLLFLCAVAESALGGSVLIDGFVFALKLEQHFVSEIFHRLLPPLQVRTNGFNLGGLLLFVSGGEYVNALPRLARSAPVGDFWPVPFHSFCPVLFHNAERSEQVSFDYEDARIVVSPAGKESFPIGSEVERRDSLGAVCQVEVLGVRL